MCSSDLHRRCCDKRWQRNKIERGVCRVQQIERSILIQCRMEFAGEIVSSTVESEEGSVGEKRANAVVAGAVDDRRFGVGNFERGVVNKTNGH